MYIPKTQYKVTVNTPGRFQGNPRGTVIEVSTGQFFNIPKQDLEKQNFDNMVEVFETQPSRQVNENVRNTYYPQPTASDYARGYIDRYFEKDSRSGKVREVRRQVQLLDQSKGFLKFLSLGWVIEGPLEDRVANGYVIPGAKSQNQHTINQAEKQLPGIKLVLKNPAQFVK